MLPIPEKDIPWGTGYGWGKRNTRQKRRNHLEQDDQITLVGWARVKGLLLISIPNGSKRHPYTAKKEVAMGLTAGVSDLFLAMPNSQYHGFWIEMKSKGNKPKPLQIAWMEKMRTQGYKAEWFDNWEKAKESIESYLMGIHNIA